MNVREMQNHKKQMNFQFLSPRLIMIIEEKKYLKAFCQMTFMSDVREKNPKKMKKKGLNGIGETET